VLQVDEKKKSLYEGLSKHYPKVPPWIVYRTVEMANNATSAFDALYDFKESAMPVVWSFDDQKWVSERIILD
jgi:hypothetical protein